MAKRRVYLFKGYWHWRTCTTRWKIAGFEITYANEDTARKSSVSLPLWFLEFSTKTIRPQGLPENPSKLLVAVQPLTRLCLSDCVTKFKKRSADLIPSSLLSWFKQKTRGEMFASVVRVCVVHPSRESVCLLGCRPWTAMFHLFLSFLNLS